VIIWQDTAYIIGTAPLNERDMMVECLSQHHGRFRAVAKYGATRKHKTTYQQGTLIACEWKAKQEHQLGTITVEVLKGYIAQILSDYPRLLAMQSAHALCSRYLYQHDHASQIFAAFGALYDALNEHNMTAVFTSYQALEITLLAETGYALSLDSCVATGAERELRYISPKSGCALSAVAGEAYKNKLFTYPAWLKDAEYTPSFAELLDAQRMNAYFLETRLGAVHNAPLPAVRERLTQHLEALAAHE
jgi:DNA repair protein RecO (recombination protein O)